VLSIKKKHIQKNKKTTDKKHNTQKNQQTNKQSMQLSESESEGLGIAQSFLKNSCFQNVYTVQLGPMEEHELIDSRVMSTDEKLTPSVCKTIRHFKIWETIKNKTNRSSLAIKNQDTGNNTTQNITKHTNNETTQDTTQDTIKNTIKDTNQDKVKDTNQDTIKDRIKDTIKEANQYVEKESNKDTDKNNNNAWNLIIEIDDQWILQPGSHNIVSKACSGANDDVDAIVFLIQCLSENLGESEANDEMISLLDFDVKKTFDPLLPALSLIKVKTEVRGLGFYAIRNRAVAKMIVNAESHGLYTLDTIVNSSNGEKKKKQKKKKSFLEPNELSKTKVENTIFETKSENANTIAKHKDETLPCKIKLQKTKTTSNDNTMPIGTSIKNWAFPFKTCMGLASVNSNNNNNNNNNNQMHQDQVQNNVVVNVLWNMDNPNVLMSREWFANCNGYRYAWGLCKFVPFGQPLSKLKSVTSTSSNDGLMFPFKYFALDNLGQDSKWYSTLGIMKKYFLWDQAWILLHHVKTWTHLSADEAYFFLYDELTVVAWQIKKFNLGAEAAKQLLLKNYWRPTGRALLETHKPRLLSNIAFYKMPELLEMYKTFLGTENLNTSVF
jgi:hypothetical protein